MSVHGRIRFQRLALNMDQVRSYRPPPNPAKITDTRARGYIAEFGRQSWELDALEPAVLEGLVRNAIEGIVDRDAMDEAEAQQKKHRGTLSLIAKKFDAVEKLVNK